MTSLSSWFKFCLLAVTMSLYACGQPEMVLPKEHCTGFAETKPTNDKNADVKLNATQIIETHILSIENTATTGMRTTGGPDKKHSSGGGPIIVIEDTHFKGSGAK